MAATLFENTTQKVKTLGHNTGFKTNVLCNLRFQHAARHPRYPSRNSSKKTIVISRWRILTASLVSQRHRHFTVGDFSQQLSSGRYDVRSLYGMNINVRLPLTNHHATPEEYEENQSFLEKYHRPGNSLIITNDELAEWIRGDFPDYRLEASVIKNINTLKKVDEAFEIYDTVILPMASNDDEKLLKAIDNKKDITLFANAGCAYTCPSKICYPSVSKANKTADKSLFRCSQQMKERNTIGMFDFDLARLQSLGFERFKLLRPRTGDMTGY